MKDPRFTKLADMLVNYSVEIKPGQTVLLQGTTAAEPLIKEVYIKVLEAGGHPITMLSFQGQDYAFMNAANEAQLNFIHEPVKYMFENYDARIYIMGEENTRSLTNTDPEKAAIRHRATGPLINTFLKRFADGEFRWTVAMCPTNAHAQEASMSLEEYEDFVFNASMPDLNDPVQFLERVLEEKSKNCRLVKGKDRSSHLRTGNRFETANRWSSIY